MVPIRYHVSDARLLTLTTNKLRPLLLNPCIIPYPSGQRIPGTGADGGRRKVVSAHEHALLVLKLTVALAAVRGSDPNCLEIFIGNYWSHDMMSTEEQ
jgi:hypothetical protein